MMSGPGHPGKRPTPCRFFSSGNCVYGDNCRNLHQAPSGLQNPYQNGPHPMDNPGMDDMPGGPMGGGNDQYFSPPFNPAPGSSINEFSPFRRGGRPRSAVGQPLSQSAKPFIPQGPMDQSLANDFAALNLASGLVKGGGGEFPPVQQQSSLPHSSSTPSFAALSNMFNQPPPSSTSVTHGVNNGMVTDSASAPSPTCAQPLNPASVKGWSDLYLQASEQPHQHQMQSQPVMFNASSLENDLAGAGYYSDEEKTISRQQGEVWYETACGPNTEGRLHSVSECDFAVESQILNAEISSVEEMHVVPLVNYLTGGRQVCGINEDLRKDQEQISGPEMRSGDAEGLNTVNEISDERTGLRNQISYEDGGVRRGRHSQSMTDGERSLKRGTWTSKRHRGVRVARHFVNTNFSSASFTKKRRHRKSGRNKESRIKEESGPVKESETCGSGTDSEGVRQARRRRPMLNIAFSDSVLHSHPMSCTELPLTGNSLISSVSAVRTTYQLLPTGSPYIQSWANVNFQPQVSFSFHHYSSASVHSQPSSACWKQDATPVKVNAGENAFHLPQQTLTSPSEPSDVAAQSDFRHQFAPFQLRLSQVRPPPVAGLPVSNFMNDFSLARARLSVGPQVLTRATGLGQVRFADRVGQQMFRSVNVPGQVRSVNRFGQQVLTLANEPFQVGPSNSFSQQVLTLLNRPCQVQPGSSGHRQIFTIPVEGTHVGSPNVHRPWSFAVDDVPNVHQQLTGSLNGLQPLLHGVVPAKCKRRLDLGPVFSASLPFPSGLSPNHSPGISPSGSPHMFRRNPNASMGQSHCQSTIPQKQALPIHQENVGGTTYFYNPDEFTPQSEGLTLPPFTMFHTTPAYLKHMKLKGPPTFFMADEIKAVLLGRQTLSYAACDPAINPEVPQEVDNYDNLIPLERTASPNAPVKSILGYPSTCYRATHKKEGALCVLRRIHNFRLNPSLNSKLMTLVETWNKLYHPNIVQLREAFTTKAFGDNSVVVSYDYLPGAETLMAQKFSTIQSINGFTNEFSGNSRSLNNQGGGVNGSTKAPTETEIWMFIVQLCSALRCIHGSGLAARTIEPTKILQFGRGRLRVNCVGVMDILTLPTMDQGNLQNYIQHWQQEDLTGLGRIVLALACNSALAVQSQNFNHAMEMVSRNYSADLKNLIGYLFETRKPRSVNDLMPMIGARFFTQLDHAQLRGDMLLNELSKEVENGRLCRLMMKLCCVLERPEFSMDAAWSETGDRYMLKLFRDYVFHAVDDQGLPWMDMSHMILCLNKFDAGVSETIVLSSRDESSVFIVSYAELKRQFTQAFHELITAGQPMGYS